jgi:hypothetical protein
MQEISRKAAKFANARPSEMMTLRQFSRKPESVPAITSWYLADLGEARGKQELFTRQSPQKLKVARARIIESAVSSNRIEGCRS